VNDEIEGLVDDAMQRIAEQEAQDVTATWNAIRADLRKAGPFSKMILSFRASALEALVELVRADPADVVRLQNEIRRYVATIQMVHGYREGAAAVELNAALSEEQRQFLDTLEEPDDD
jgi:hypothetical protein